MLRPGFFLYFQIIGMTQVGANWHQLIEELGSWLLFCKSLKTEETEVAV